MTRLRSSATTALFIGALALAGPQIALAKQYTVYSCHTPGGAYAATYGWIGTRSPTSGLYLLVNNTCAPSGQGALIGELPGRAGGYANSEVAVWNFTAPWWSAIAHYTIALQGSYARGCCEPGSGDAWVKASDEQDPIYDFRNLGQGSAGAVTIERTPPDKVEWVQVLAACNSGCPAAYISEIAMARASFLLEDTSLPKAQSFAGSLTSGKPVSSTAEGTLEASDPQGPGLYAAYYVVDGVAQPATLLDPGAATCTNLGETTDGTRAFDSPEPCAAKVQQVLGIETTTWKDGEHNVKLVLEDAAGNTATVFDQAVTFHNAPVVASAPVDRIEGAAQYRAEEPSADALERNEEATFTAPAGAGNVTTEGFWERCDASGANCQRVPGASPTRYVFGPADVGATIRYASVGADKDGSSIAQSAATPVITEKPAATRSAPGPESPLGVSGTSSTTTSSTTTTVNDVVPGAVLSFTGLSARWLKVNYALTRTYGRSALTLSGRLSDATGAPLAGQTVYLYSGPLGGGLREIAEAKTDPRGQWLLRAPKGPSRLLRVAYGAQSATAPGSQYTRDVVEHVSPTVSLRISSANGTITFSGRVGFARTQPPLLVLVQARGSHGWQTAGEPVRVGPGGRIHATYSAPALVGRTYAWRLLVPATRISLAATSRVVRASIR